AFGQAQRQLQVTEEQAHHAKQEARSLYTQLHAVSSGAAAERSQANGGHLSPPVDRHAGAPPPPEGVASASQSSTSASLLFLQWQNAHLHAEVRHFQQALSAAKSELQMQLMAGQLLESKHGLLQARVEHLELDLGFKQACGGGGSGMPPFGNGMDDMFAACDLGGLGGPFNRAGSGPGATFLEGSVAGGYGPGVNGPVGMGGFGAGSVGMGSSFHEGSVAGGFGPTANGPVGMGSGGFAGGLGGCLMKKKKTKKDKKKPKKKEKKKKDKKKGKKDKKKDKKKGKKEEGKEKKKGKGAKKKNRSGVAVSNQYGKYGIIKPEDFFNKKPEFLSWAMDVKKSNTDAMGQMQQRDLFKEYIEDYNTATMPCKKYYNMGVWEQETAAKRKKKLMATDLDEKERNSLVSFDDENARKMEMAANKAKKHENLIKQEVGNLRMNKEKAEEMMHQTRLRGQVDMLRQTGHE
ncbi:unnamed protein product, partial [Polarella glacialis]